MLRQSLLLAAATVAFAGAGQAQTRGQSRDDLLDALTRHIQICGESGWDVRGAVLIDEPALGAGGGCIGGLAGAACSGVGVGCA